MSKSISTILRGISALTLSIAGLAVFAGVASAAAAIAAPTAAMSSATTATVSFGAISGDLSYVVSAQTGGSGSYVACANQDGLSHAYLNSSATTGTLTATCAVVTGFSYTFKVQAFTAVAGASSDPVNTLSTASDALVAAPYATVTGTGSATVGFTTDGTNLAYLVTSSPGSLTCSVTVSAGAGAAKNCLVIGLTNGTSYTFTLTSYASTTAGTVVTTYATSNAVTPGGTPNAPTGISATDNPASSGYGSGAITVAWTTPANNGVGITGFQVTNSASLSTATVVCTTSNPLATSCTFTPTWATPPANLYVEALTTGGTSVASSAVSINAPPAPTGAPTVVQSGGYTTISLATVSVTSDSSLKNTKWTVLYGANTVCTAAATASTCTFSNASAGLAAGDPGVFTIKMYNAAGPTADTTPTSSVIIGQKPSAFTATAATVNSKGYVLVSWTAPATSGATAISSYQVKDSTGATTFTCTAVTSTSCYVLIDLANSGNNTGSNGKIGYGYNGVILVIAVNDASLTQTAATNVINNLAVPAAPTGLPTGTYSGSTGYLTLGTSGGGNGWTASTTSGVTHQIVTLYTCTTNAAVASNTCTASGSPIVVGSNVLFVTNAFAATPGSYYTYSVQAVNAVGASAAAFPTSVITAGTGAPTAPTTAKISNTTNSSITVAWTAPSFVGGSAVTGYAVQLYTCTSAVTSSVSAACGSTTGNPVVLTGSTLSYTFTGLPAGFYAARVYATNAVGTETGGTMTASSVEVDKTPGNPTVVYGTSTITFLWTSLSSTTAPYTVASYNLINSATGATICTAATTATSCTVAGSLVTGTYAVKLSTTDSAGVTSGQGTVTPTKPADTIAALNTSSGNNISTNDAGDILLSWNDSNGSSTKAASYTVLGLGSDGTTLSYSVSAATVTNTTGTGNYFLVIPVSAMTATSYTFQVAAVNALGATSYTTLATYNTVTGAVGGSYALISSTLASTPVVTLSTPSVGGVITATISNASGVTQSTTAATFNPILNYTIVLTGADGSVQTCTTTSGVDAATCTFTGLTIGAKYSATATANAALGSSLTSTATAGILATGVPATPVVGTVANYGATAATAAGTAIVVYFSSANSGGVGMPSLASTSATATGGANATTIGATGITAAVVPGELVYDATTSTVIGTVVTVTAGTGFTVTANTATVTTGDVLYFSPYVVSATTAAGATKYCTATTLNSTYCVISGLTANTAYAIAVTAVNANGTSTAGKGVFTTGTVAGAPTAVTATAYGSSTLTGQYVNVSWTAPVSAGGTGMGVASYTITASGTDLTYGNTVKFSTAAANSATTSSSSGDATTINMTGAGANTAIVVGQSIYAGTTLIGTVASKTTDSITTSANLAATIASGTTLSFYSSSPLICLDNTNLTSSSPFTGYTVGTVAATSALCLVVDGTYADTGDGVSMKFNVQAVNGTGSPSAAASSNAVQPVVAPVAPTVQVNATTTAFVLAWSDANATNGATNTYKVSVTGGTNGTYTTTTSATTLTLPYGSNGLVLGGSYTFQVASVSATGVASSWATAVTASVPSDVSYVRVYAQTTSGAAATTGFTLVWNSVATSSLYPVTYNVTATAGGTTVINTTVSTTTYSLAIPGLTSTVAGGYTWSVTALNAKGSANTVSEIAGTRFTNAVVPASLSTVTTSAGAASGTYAGVSIVSASFAAIANTAAGSGGLSGTAVTATTSAGTAYAATGVAGTNNILTFSSVSADVAVGMIVAGIGIPNGTRVTAKTGTTVTLSSYVTSVGVGSGATITFGGAPLTYTVTATNTATGTVTACSAASTSHSATAVYLCAVPTGASYAVTANVANAVGSATTASVAYIATPVDTVSASSGITTSQAAAMVGVTPVNTLTVNWTAVPGATNYVVVASTTAAYVDTIAHVNSNAANVIFCPSVLTGLSTSCTLSVTGASIYYVSVFATNVAGYSTQAALVNYLGSATTVTALAAPAAPGSVTTITNTYGAVGSLTISWTAASTTTYSLPVTSYITTLTGQTSGAVVTCTSTTTSCAFTGLANEEYSVAVRAFNAYNTTGTSASGTTTSLWTAPSAAPVITSITSTTKGSLTVNWTAPVITAGTNGSSVTGYTVTAGTATCGVVDPTATSCTLTGLKDSTAYTVVIVATNAVGTSSTAEAMSATTMTPIVPGAPTGVTATAAFSTTYGDVANVTWTANSSTGGLAVTGFTVTATNTTTGAAVTCTITGAASALCPALVAGNSYAVKVTETTAGGTSVASTPAVVATFGVPKAVTGVTAVRNANGLQVSWTPTAGAYGAVDSTTEVPVLGYIVSATDQLTGAQFACGVNATYGVVLAPAVTCNIAGLTVGSNYTVSVKAANLLSGLSPAATVSALYNSLTPEPVMATFLAVTAKQKSVSALSPAAKTALSGLISSTNDGAQITVTGYGTTKAIALARANAAANYLFRNGAAVHVTIKTVISKTVKTALVTVTSN